MPNPLDPSDFPFAFSEPDPSKRSKLNLPIPKIPTHMLGKQPEEFWAGDAQTETPAAAENDSGLTMSERNNLLKILAERNRRRKEALKIFVPLPNQKLFFESKAPERLLRGGNRGGKSICAAVEVARAVTGQDPFGKYPAKNGKFAAVGWDLQHCADVMWNALYKPGAFKVIKDPITKEFRAYNPNDPWDSEHEYLSDPSAPLIPKRFIKEIAWDDKRKGIPKVVRLTTGWELTFYTSKGDPPQGVQFDGAWFDEEIMHPDWYKEISARMLDRRRKLQGGEMRYPRFLWSATPLAGTEKLLELHQRAIEEAHLESPIVEEFFLGLLDNPHISQQSKEEFIKKLNNQDEYNVRVLGDFAIAGTRVYPEFMPKGVHGIQDFPIPADWTRYCAIDPGFQVCAVLFCAVPPPNCEEYDPSRVYFYRELYLKRCDAKRLAKEMKEITKNETIEQWWIDHTAGRMTQIASGKTPEQQYTEEFKALDVKCIRTGYEFSWGASDVSAGILSVRSGLHIRQEEGNSRFVFFREGLKNLLWEMDRYSYKRTPKTNTVTDDIIKLNDHICDLIRYLAQANLKYVRPKVGKQKRGYTTEILKAKQERARRNSAWGGAVKLG